MTSRKMAWFSVTFPFIVLMLLIGVWLISIASDRGIKIHNGCEQSYASFIKDQADTNRQLSFCDNWNKDKLFLQSDYISLAKYMTFEYIGFPSDENLSIVVEDKAQHQFKIKNLKQTSEHWRKKIVTLPSYMEDKVRLVATDTSVGKYGWLGIGNIKTTNFHEVTKMPKYIQTLMLILIFSLVISILFGFFLKYASMLRAYVYMSLFVGLTSLLAFNTYLISIYLGYVFSGGVALFIVFALMKIEKKEYLKISYIFVFLVSMLSILFFLAYSNFPDLSNMAQVSGAKWHHFPVDNWLPKFFADAILQGRFPSPIAGDWLSSDRPPLQTGLFLVFGSFSPNDTVYLVTSVGAQLLVVPFVVLLVSEYIADKKFVFLAAILFFFNGLVFVNGLNVWPKLFSALYQGIAFYYLYQIWVSKEKQMSYYILFGIAAILAFLTHGGSIFYLLSLSILLVFTLKSKKEVQNLFYGFSVAILLYIPWVIYQKFIDPPGDRLLKWHLTDQHQITSDSFFTVLVDYYSRLSFSEWIDIRVSHLKYIFHSMYFDITHLFSLPLGRLRDNIFFSIDYSYMFFSTLLLLGYWVSAKRLKEKKTFLKLMLLSFLLYLILWVLILASGTVIHQGAHFGWFSGFIAVTIIAYYLNPYLFYILGILNLILFGKIYVVGYLFDKDMISSSICIAMVGIFIVNLILLLSQDRNKNASN